MRKNGPASLAILWFTIFLDLLGFGIIIPILPVIAKELALNDNLSLQPDFVVGIIVAIFSFMQFLFSPLVGIISDRVGRRPVLLITILLTTIGSILFGFSTNIVWLFLSRIFSGLGSANIPTAQAYIADVTAPELRAQKMGLIGAAFGIGFVFGPAVGAALIFIAKTYSLNSIQLLGFVSAGLGLINFFLAYFILPESLNVKNPNSTSSFLKSYSGLGTYMKMPALKNLFLINLIYITAFVLMQSNCALLWKEHFGLDEDKIYLIFGFIGVCTAIVQGLFIKKFQLKFGLNNMLIIGSVLVGVAIILIPFPSKKWFFIFQAGIIICLATGNGMLMPALNSLVSAQANAQEQGKVLGFFQSISSFGRFISPLLAGILYHFHFSLPYLIAGLLMLACLLISLKTIKSLKVT